MNRSVAVQSFVCLAAVFAVSFTATQMAQAAYPDHTITIIHPYPPGASSDVSMRKIAHGMEGILGQQVIIENKPGASGIPAVTLASKAKPDGYTLVFGTEQTHGSNTALFKSLPYDPIKDFTPVAELWESVMIETFNAQIPGSSIKDFVTYAKAHPGLKFGSNGIGSTPHLGVVDFANREGINMVHVAYTSQGELLTDLANGNISAVFMTYGAMRPLIDAGKIKVLAVASTKRLAVLPNVPTMIESGVPNYTSVSWDALFAPAGTPKPIVDTLYKAISQVLHQKDMNDYFESTGAVVALKDSDQMKAFMPGAIAALHKQVQEAGAKVQ
jgi:tripartite-type tricarboxylate transporter receptor subunit TctC